MARIDASRRKYSHANVDAKSLGPLSPFACVFWQRIIFRKNTFIRIIASTGKLRLNDANTPTFAGDQASYDTRILRAISESLYIDRNFA